MTPRKRPWPPDAELRDLTLSMLDGFLDQETREMFRNGVDVSWEQFQQNLFEADCDAARRGDPEPLRQRFPQIAEFIQAPPLDNGKRYQGPVKHPSAAFIRKRVRAVREFWAEEYGRRNRPMGSGITIEKIVAEHLQSCGANVTAREVEAALHSSGPDGKKSKNRKSPAT